GTARHRDGRRALVVDCRFARPRRRSRRGGGDAMTRELQRSNGQVDVEEVLVRYLAERRMTRRQLLELMGSIGVSAALAPIVAACAGAASPSAAPPSPSAGGPSASSPASASPTPSPTPVPSPEGELFVYNWDQYIGADTVSKFEDKYKVKV